MTVLFVPHRFGCCGDIMQLLIPLFDCPNQISSFIPESISRAKTMVCVKKAREKISHADEMWVARDAPRPTPLSGVEIYYTKATDLFFR